MYRVLGTGTDPKVGFQIGTELESKISAMILLSSLLRAF